MKLDLDTFLASEGSSVDELLAVAEPLLAMLEEVRRTKEAEHVKAIIASLKRAQKEEYIAWKQRHSESPLLAAKPGSRRTRAAGVL